MLDERPNIVLFFTDQQRWDTVGAYGSPAGLTLNLDAAAARGTLFERAFTCQPVCAPARGCIQTGRWATEHGVWRNGFALAPEEVTLGHRLRDAGYRTGYIGKWHLANTNRDPVPAAYRSGYDDWLASDVLEYTSHPYNVVMYDGEDRPVHLPGYRVDALTGAAIRYIEGRADEKSTPFFLTISYIEPHQQNDFGKLCAPDGYAARHANPRYVPWDLVGTAGDWRRELADYFGMIERLDEAYGRLLATLDRLDLARRTVVLFLTDHGCHFRTRNSEYKRSAHETSIRIPLVARGPGFDGRGTMREIVSLIDIAPTVVDLAGLSVPETMRGHSLRGLFDERRRERPDDAFVQVSEAEVGRAVRTKRWKYSVQAPELNGWQHSAADKYVEASLYDLAADPWETRNLAGRPEYRDVADELRARLLRRIVGAGECEPEIVPAGPR